jgi:uncharacterized membrane protein
MRFLKSALRVLLGLFFIGAGINHFLNPDFYIRIMPDYIPWHATMVYLSGLSEIAAGGILFVARWRVWAAWAIVAMLVVFLTVHLHMIVHAERYESVPLSLLYIRLALQFVLIAWGWWYTRAEPQAALQSSAGTAA